MFIYRMVVYIFILKFRFFSFVLRFRGWVRLFIAVFVVFVYVGF